MGLMDRLSRLIRANVNDMLERAEDPERMLNQILRDMESNITTARSQIAAMIAQEKELEADLAEVQELSQEWQAKAQRAVQAGKDDLAREALRRKRDNDESAAVYQQQLAVQQQTIEKLKSQLRTLESKYQSTLSQRDALIARQRRAVAQQQVAQTLTTFSPMDPTSELDRIERKIRSGESQVTAMIEMHDDSLDVQLAELDVDDDVEQELQALKAGMGSTPEAIGQGASTSESTAATS
jgi:phage shock protein A